VSDAVRFPLVLGIISLCSAFGLAVTYSLTRDEIRRQEQLKKNRGLAAVFGVELPPDQANPPWEPVGASDENPPVFRFTDPKTGRRLYAAEGAGQGYSSKVRVVVAVDQAVETDPDNARVKAMRVVSQRETPGFGTRCTEPEFQAQFEELVFKYLKLVKGSEYRDPKRDKDGTQPIAAITGATITSNACVRAVSEAVLRIQDALEGANAAGKK